MTSTHTRALALAFTLLAAACIDRDDPTSPRVGDPNPPPADAPNKDVSAPARHIVVLRSDLPDAVAGAATESLTGGLDEVHYRYEHALHGFSATLGPDELARLRADPRVAFVEPDRQFFPSDTQRNAIWNLDRIDQRGSTLDSLYVHARTGAGVRAYVIDSGIRVTHTQFGGRASVGAFFTGTNGNDCSGHGTHVAGTIGGSLVGVAKQVTLIAVRVFGCTGGADASTIIAAIDWVTANAVKPAVVNMSLGGPVSEAMEEAIRASVGSGLTYIVAAGNDGADACLSTPARMPEVITVGAMRSDRRRSSFSNHGACVDIFAPGTNVASAWYTTDNAIVLANGTSMASPHVAGAAALWLENHVTATPASVRGRILQSASHGQVTELPFGTANLLLYSRLTVQRGARAAFNSSESVFLLLNPGDPIFDAPALAVPPQPAVGRRGLTLRNTGTDTMSWTATDNAAWLDVTPGSGSIPPGGQAVLEIEVNSAQLDVGEYVGQIRVDGPGIINGPVFHAAYLDVRRGSILTSGVPLELLWDVAGSRRFYRIAVPAGATQLIVTVPTGSGDTDMYVRPGVPPTLDEWHCRPFLDVAEETCTIPAPQPGVWWIMIHGFEGYSRLTLVATVT